MDQFTPEMINSEMALEEQQNQYVTDELAVQTSDVVLNVVATVIDEGSILGTVTNTVTEAVGTVVEVIVSGISEIF